MADTKLDVVDDFKKDVIVVEEEPAEIETYASLMRPALAEFVGSLLFIYFACGSAAGTIRFSTAGTTLLGISFAFGFMITTLAFTIGHISGGHLNFAVTFSFFVVKKITAKRCVAYFLSQLTGGIVGAILLRLTVPDSYQVMCLASNIVQDDTHEGRAFLGEMMGTFFLLIVVNAATDKSKSNQTLVPLAIGFAVFCAHMFLTPITGTSINPTRTIASAIGSIGLDGCAKVWDDMWVFWLGPLIGGVLATLFYEYALLEESDDSSSLMSMYKKKKTKKN